MPPKFHKFHGCYFIVMEKLGINLKDIVFKVYERLCMIDILKLGLQLVNIVEKMHNLGYIHKDIKPDNILIGDYTHILPDQKLDRINNDQSIQL